MKKVIVLFFVLMLVAAGQAANIYVNHTGSDTSPYDTEEKGTDLATAIGAASSFDVILIKADSMYTVNTEIDISSGKYYLTIKGYHTTPGDCDYGGTYYKAPISGYAVFDGSADYVIDVNYSLREITFENVKTTTSPLIKNSNTTIYYNTLISLRNCSFQSSERNNVSNMTGYVAYDCDFVTSGNRGGISITWTDVEDVIVPIAVFDRCTFTIGETYCEEPFNIDGEALDNNNAAYIRISNCLIDASAGGCYEAIKVYGIADGAMTLDVYNNTIYGGPDKNIVEAIRSSVNTNCYNNIIYGVENVFHDDGGRTHSFFNNCYYHYDSLDGYVAGTGDINADPQFTDAANGDFTLLPTSPCIDAGFALTGSYNTMGVFQRKYENVSYKIYK